MPATTGSEVEVEAPGLQEPVVGLLAQVPVITGPEADRWLAGMVISPESYGAPEFAALCTSDHVKDQDAIRFPARRIHPFELIVHDRCSTWAFRDADYEGRVTRALAVKSHWGVDREFEKGELIPDNLHLADTYTASGADLLATVTLGGGVAVSPKDALALLDEAIATNPAIIGRGMIFATVFVVDQWKAAGLLTKGEGNQLLSPVGNYVVAGTGFEGRGPAGTVPASHASQWAYATDLIAVVAGTPTTFPPTFLESVNMTENQVITRQEQWFAIVWSGLLHAAVNVSTSTPLDSDGGGEGGGSVTSSTGTSTTVANSITTGTLLAANAARKGAIIYNDDTGASLYVKLGTAASTSSFTVKLNPGGYYEVPYGYTGIITGIATAATGNARITEVS